MNPRLSSLALPLALSLVRDRGEAEGLLCARAESDLFVLLSQRRARAVCSMRNVEVTARTLSNQQSIPNSPHVEACQTFSSAVPLVSRCLSVMRQQVALLDDNLRECVGRLRALVAELEQNAQVNERVSHELNHLVHSLRQESMRPLALGRLNLAETQRAIALEIVRMLNDGDVLQYCHVGAAFVQNASTAVFVQNDPFPRLSGGGGRGLGRRGSPGRRSRGGAICPTRSS